MIYLLRLVIWLMIIVFISWGIHKILKKHISNKRLKPFIGVIAFLVIILTPITIAKVAQLYYCWKYQPFYKIIKPLGDDFHGYFKSNNVGSLRPILKKYENVVDFVDTTKVNFIVDDEYGSVDEKIIYIRKYIDNNTSSNCVFPNKNYFKHQNERLRQGKKPDVLEDLFSKEGKCIAEKIIPESEVSRYEIGGKALENEIPFFISGIVEVWHTKTPIITNRVTTNPYATIDNIIVEWDLYGVSGIEGTKPKFRCQQLGFNIKDKLIKQVGEKNGN